jgi:hypothetical protein
MKSDTRKHLLAEIGPCITGNAAKTKLRWSLATLALLSRGC